MAKAKSKTDPPPRIYVDTCVYIDLLTKEAIPHPVTGEPRWKSAKGLMNAVNDGRVVLAASALVDAEIGCFALVRDGGQEIHEQVRGWLDAPATKYTEVDRVLARDAARLARKLHQQVPQSKQLRSADAVHLAAAVRLSCGYLMTQDRWFPLGQKVEGVQVTLTEEVWVPTLFG